MITKDEANKKLKMFLEEYEISEAISKFLKFLVENYNSLDEDAKELLEKANEILIKFIKDSIDKMPDSIDRRILERELGKLQETNFNSKLFIQNLESQSNKDVEIIKDTKLIFENKLQSILDFLFDVSKKDSEGLKTVAIIGLFYLCIDELLSAFHLLQHTYVTQSYSHLRSIWENIDNIDLFNNYPDVLELWFSEEKKDDRKRFETFKPSAVRKKLGKPGFDPIYSYFSELGSHGTFSSIKSRSGMLENKSGDEKRKLKFWIGGSPYEHHIISNNVFFLITLYMVLFKVFELYVDNINRNESLKICLESVKEIDSYFTKYIIPWATLNKLNISVLENWKENNIKIIDSLKEEIDSN